MVDRCKKLGSIHVPLNKLGIYDKRLVHFSRGALDIMYHKTLKHQRAKYDELVIPLNFEIPVDEEFMNNYKKVKKIFETEQEFNNRTYPSLYNWFTNWRYSSEYKDVKKKKND